MDEFNEVPISRPFIFQSYIFYNSSSAYLNFYTQHAV